jgi:site-specific recombinase XerD
MVNVDTIITRYTLFARSEGFSPKTIKHTVSAVNYFTEFLGGIDDVTKVTADDLRRFIVGLQSRKRWANRTDVKIQGKISGTSINTYTRAIKAFWSWMQRQGIITKNPLADVSAPGFPALASGSMLRLNISMSACEIVAS